MDVDVENGSKDRRELVGRVRIGVLTVTSEETYAQSAFDCGKEDGYHA